MKKAGFSILAVLMISGFSLPSFSVNQENIALSTEDVIEKINESIEAAPEMNRWQASVLTTLYEMDKKWEPKKKTVIEKQIVVDNKTRIEKVYKAVEYKDDEIKDVTNEFKEEAAKMNAKNRSSDGKESGGRHRGMNLGMDEIFPFNEEKRKDYDFSLSKETGPDSREVYILKTVSKQESSEFFEGTYTIDADTLAVLRAELSPAKNPGPLKLLEMDMEFDRLPEGYLVMTKASARVHVGLIIKNIRMQTEEIYSDYEIFNQL
jgi:hypothetical protein